MGRMKGKRDIGFQKVSNQARRLRLEKALASLGSLLFRRYFFRLRLEDWQSLQEFLMRDCGALVPLRCQLLRVCLVTFSIF